MHRQRGERQGATFGRAPAPGTRPHRVPSAHPTQLGNVQVHVVASTAARRFFDTQQVHRLDASAALDYTVADLAAENAGAQRRWLGVQDTPHARKRVPRARVWTDEDEWSAWAKLGDPVLHIEVRQRAEKTQADTAVASLGRHCATGTVQCRHTGQDRTRTVRQPPGTSMVPLVALLTGRRPCSGRWRPIRRHCCSPR